MSPSDPSGAPEPEHPLPGGFVNEVVRVGSTVRRPTGTWTPAVHSLLRHLESVGFKESPRVLGIDDRGREILTYVEGTAIGWNDWPVVLLDGDGVSQLGDLLRRYHDSVRSFQTPPHAQWRNPLAPKDSELVRHGDFSPFNTVWSNNRVVGVIDWDFAQPGKAISDLAYLAWYAVPFTPDARAAMFGFDPGMNRAGRLEALCDAYGGQTPRDVVDEAVRIIEVESIETAELARRGVQPWVGFLANGNLESFAADVRWIREIQHLLAR